LLDRAVSVGEMDLIRDFALPLPMTIITEILGVPAKDHDKFHSWSQAVVSLSSPNPTLRVMLRVIPGVWSLFVIFDNSLNCGVAILKTISLAL
jgi:cytochrome P450